MYVHDIPVDKATQLNATHLSEHFHELPWVKFNPHRSVSQIDALPRQQLG